MSFSDDLEPVQSRGSFKSLMAVLHARKKWEAANPELARAWTEALAEDAAWQYRQEVLAARQRDEADAPHLLGRLGVPLRAARALRALDLSKPAVVAARRYLAELKALPLLCLLGNAGTGKTVASAYIALQYLLARPRNGSPSGTGQADPVMWVASAELANLSSFTQPDRDWFERMQACGLLVLDDFAAEALHETALARLERLVDVRYGNGRPTVFTTNADPETLKARAGARITDRLRESGRVVNCGAESMRKAAK